MTGMKSKQAQDLIIVTGFSGAGMSSVLKTLEDLGFEVFDNFPLSLVESLLQDPEKPGTPIAIGIDTRARGFSEASVLETVSTHRAQLLFLTCDESTLQKRFTETRRKHPLAGRETVIAGIEREKTILGGLQNKAHLTIDTTHLSIHDLKHLLKGHFDLKNQDLLSVTLMSFGFRGGLPRQADIVMDVRFLQNPHWDENLRPKTGKDKDVGDYIRQDDAFAPFIQNFERLLETVLPRYAQEGKTYLTIAIGCTGGRHRSVFTVETLGKWLRNQGIAVNIDHRDLPPQ